MVGEDLGNGVVEVKICGKCLGFESFLCFPLETAHAWQNSLNLPDKTRQSKRQHPGQGRREEGKIKNAF